MYNENDVIGLARRVIVGYMGCCELLFPSTEPVAKTNNKNLTQTPLISSNRSKSTEDTFTT